MPFHGDTLPVIKKAVLDGYFEIPDTVSPGKQNTKCAHTKIEN